MQVQRNEHVQDRRTCYEHRFNKMQEPYISLILIERDQIFLKKNAARADTGIDTEHKIERDYNHALLTAAIQKVVSCPYEYV